VSIELTKRCTLTAFAIDVTPRLQAEANDQAELLRARIEAALPEVRAPLEAIWGVLGSTIQLGRGTCARLVPTDVVQTGVRLVEGPVRTLRGGVGVEGRLSLEAPCADGRGGGRGSRSPHVALPPPKVRLASEARRDDHSESRAKDNSPDERGIDLRVPVVVPWDEASRAAARSLGTGDSRYAGHVVRVLDASLGPADGGEVTLDVTIAGEVCGALSFVGKLGWQNDRNGLGFVSLRPRLAESAPTATTTASSSTLMSDLKARLRIPLPVDITALGSTVRRTLDALVPREALPKGMRVEAALDEAGVELVLPTRDGVAAVVAARGEVNVRLLVE
jgi:hypothetical protein